MGRTGLRGRGRLGRWGPNHAADPIVTRWKRIRPPTANNDGVVEKMDEVEVNKDTNKPILEFVAVLRDDTNEWAIPGVSLC
jgi:ADP-ribose pyrophosphatase